MGPLVCMSLEEMEKSVSTGTTAAMIYNRSGLWSCNIPDSSRKMQSLYTFILAMIQDMVENIL